MTQTMRVGSDEVVRAGGLADARPGGTMRLDAEAIVRAAAPAAMGQTARADGPVLRAGAADSFSVVRAGSLADRPVVLNGRAYQVEKVISQGRTGEADIFLVRQGDRELVLKRYRHALSPKLEVLEQLKRLEHPSIVRLVDYGTADECFCEVMELARGGTLDKHLPIDDPARFKALVRELVAGFKACHDLGIVHRDVKPSNVFCRNADGTGPMLADFGISSFLDEGQSRKVTMQRLTIDYAAPETFGVVLPGEQARVVVGPAADYYSLGLTLLEAHTGKPVFDPGLGAFAISDLIRAGNVPIPEELPADVRTLVRGLTTVNHLRRWGYDEVQRWLAGEPVEVDDQAAAPRTYPRFEFARVGGKVQAAQSPREMADLLREHPQQGQKHLYRGELAAWLRNSDLPLSSALRDLVEEELPRDRELGLFKAVYLLDPRQPFLTGGGAAVAVREPFEATLRSVGDALEAEKATSLPELTGSPHPRLFLWLDALGQHDYLGELRRCLKNASAEKAFHRVILLLQGRDSLKIDGLELRSFSDLENAPSAVQRRLAEMLHQADSKFLVWLEEMGLKADSQPIATCDTEALLALVKGMPWLKKRDKELLKRLNQRDEAGWTDLMRAARAGQAEACRELLASGAKVEQASPAGDTALAAAALAGQLEAMRVLLEGGADPNPTNAEGRALLQQVLEVHEQTAPLELLLRAKADPNRPQPSDGWRPLQTAASLGRHDAARLLLDHGAGPDLRAPEQVDSKGDFPPLAWAALEGDERLARLLIERGADVGAAASDGWTPLHFAAKKGKLGVARLLLDAKAPTERGTEFQVTPLWLASANGHLEVARLLLERGANVRAVDVDGWTPLHAAVAEDQPELVAPLVAAGAPLDLPFKREDGRANWTLLHEATANGKAPLARELLRSGAAIEARDSLGCTPLRIAVANLQVELVRLLLEHGADPNTRDAAGFTPLHFPQKGDGPYDLGVVELLLAKGADASVGGGEKKHTPVHHAIFDKQYGALRLYVERRSGLEARDALGYSPLMLACELGLPKAVRMLVKAGVRRDHRSTDGQTAMDLALRAGNTAVIKRLAGENVRGLARLARLRGLGAMASRALAAVLAVYGFTFLMHQRQALAALGDAPWAPLAAAALGSYALTGYLWLLGLASTRRYLGAPDPEGVVHRLVRLVVRPALPGPLLLGYVALAEKLGSSIDSLPMQGTVAALYRAHALRPLLGDSASDGLALGANLALLAALLGAARLLARGTERAREVAEALEEA